MFWDEYNRGKTVQIIIPMSGFGERFIRAGYKDIKPLIRVHNRPLIEWVVKMFPGENDFIFICQNEHLEKTELKNELKRIKPDGKIFGIDSHKKGPVYAVANVFDEINNEKPSLVSYCDYYMHWDYKAFKTAVINKGVSGAIPCYTGFHPNLLPAKNFYASCKTDENQNLIEIKEKFSWTENKEKSLQSPGVYYFKSGKILKDYFEIMLKEGPALNNEYYISLVYNFMVKNGLDVWVPENVDYFCQWGTPEDLEEYLFWVDLVKGVKE